MDPENEKPRVTEIRVRMDCNGCVQKIKKALHGVNGIYDLYIDFPQQKITIIGSADPEKIVKAIKKIRKTAIICAHAEPSDQEAQLAEPESEGSAPEPQEPTNQPAEPPQGDPGQAEPPKDTPPPPDNPPPAEAGNSTSSQPAEPPKPQDGEEVHVVYHYPPDHGYTYGYGHNVHQGYGAHWNPYPGTAGYREEPHQPVYVTHSYNTYKPSPYITEYAYVRPPPQSPMPPPPSPPLPRTCVRRPPPPPTYVRPSPPPPTQPPEPIYVRPPPTQPPPPQPTYVHPPPQPPTPPPQPPQHTYYSRPVENHTEGYHSGMSYNTYKPSPYVNEYAYYARSPSRYVHYNRPDQYSDYRNGNNNGNGNGNITSIFSDENPNACTIA